jgi:hypothetical protein
LVCFQPLHLYRFLPDSWMFREDDGLYIPNR